MTMTPQSNATLDEVARELQARDNFVICGHVGPDGDCLGSQLALMHVLRACGKHAVCVFADEEPSLDEALSFLPGFDEVMTCDGFSGAVDVFVGVDVPTVERIGRAAKLHECATWRITVDHHAVETTMSETVHVDPDAAATALLVWEIAKKLVGTPSADIALCAYTGLCTDTGRFQYQNTDARCLSGAAEMVAAGADPAFVAREVFQNRRLASICLEGRAVQRMKLLADGKAALSWVDAQDFEELDAVKADAEPLVNTLRAIRGVRVACMLRQQGDVVRGSFRAKDDTDVAVIARSFGGGGHKAAAGFTLEMPMDKAIATVGEALEKLVGCDGAPAGEGVLQ